MNNGFWMKALRVDLSSETFSVEELDEEVLKQFIGGAGMGAWFLAHGTDATTDALDPGNIIVFSTGPYQATKLPGSAKFSIVSRSPLTGGFMDTAAGASFGHSLKKCGFDFLVITGKSKKPLYLYVDDGKYGLYDAKDLRGVDTFEVNDYLRELYPKASVAAIGKAGENMVASACIYVDGYSAAGRGGLGAVMGSKGLKAVAVRGNAFPETAEPEKLKDLEREYRKSIAEISKPLRDGGTVGGLVPGSEAGNLPVKNWSIDGWPGHAEKIGYPAYQEILQPKLHPCNYCPVACHRQSDVDMPSGWHYKGPTPEYETLALLGANCMIDDLDILTRANDFCNRQGIDTMSAGSCAGFAMEALERGHTAGNTPNYSFTWGDGEGLLKFLRELVDCQGFGGLFSNGIRKAVECFDPAAADYACHVKGMDVPAHDPRLYYNMSINYATGNRGACHMRAYSQISTMGALLPEAGIDQAPPPDTLEGAAELVKIYQDFTSFYNASVLCQFMIWGGLGISGMVEWLNAITGWKMENEDLLSAGERIFTLQRLLNNRWGITAKDDILPKRFFEPSSEGGRKGKYPKDFDSELKRLYEYRSWDKEGRPTKEKLAELNLSFAR